MPNKKIIYISASEPLTKIILTPRYTFLLARIHKMTSGMHKNKVC